MPKTRICGGGGLSSKRNHAETIAEESRTHTPEKAERFSTLKRFLS